jgi:hypothetical protein
VPARWWRTAGDPAGQPDGSARPDAVSAELIADLLEDMQDLRLTLVADLSAVAAAVETDSERIAADIVECDRQELLAVLRRDAARLSTRVDDATVTAVQNVPKPRSWRRRVVISLPAVPLVGALAMSAAAAAGLLPLPTHSGSHHARVVSEGAPVSSTFQNFETVLAGDPSASQVVAAASALHQQIAAMIATAPQDPGGVTEVAHLLQLEQALLLRKQPPGSSLILAQSRELAAQLQDIASRTTTAQPTPATVPTSPSSTPHKTTTAKSTPTSSTSPKSTTKSSPASSPSPSSSPSSTDAPGHIPTIGG